MSNNNPTPSLPDSAPDDVVKDELRKLLDDFSSDVIAGAGVLDLDKQRDTVYIPSIMSLFRASVAQVVNKVIGEDEVISKPGLMIGDSSEYIRDSLRAEQRTALNQIKKEMGL